MVPKQPGKFWSDLLADVVENPQLTAAIPRRAVNCDLCHDLIKPGREPFCVSACPHKAAFRWDGGTLLREVQKRSV
jgi:Fe-S-cluster-containing dehydrogenase component